MYRSIKLRKTVGSLQCLLLGSPRQRSCRLMSTVLLHMLAKGDQSGIDVTLPGYSFEHLDRYGNVTMDRVARACEATRMSLYAPQFTQLPPADSPGYREVIGRVYKDGLIFALTGNFDILPGLYDKRHLYNPVVFTDQLMNIGKTSYQHHSIATSVRTRQQLHKSVFHVVIVDKETRRPRPLPEYVLDHFKNVDTKAEIERVELLMKPEKTHSRQYTPRWSDTDYYLHINQASYVKICYDMLVEVSLDGAFRSLQGDLARYWVTNFKCYYVNEAKPGEVLDIHTWESEDEPMKVHAVAEKQGTPVFQLTFQFTSPPS